MIYVAPVSRLSSGPLSLITAIRLPLHRRSPCLRPAITASLLSHIHKGKGRILSPRLPLQRSRDAKKGASMCSGELKAVIYLIIASQTCWPSSAEVFNSKCYPSEGLFSTIPLIYNNYGLVYYFILEISGIVLILAFTLSSSCLCQLISSQRSSLFLSSVFTSLSLSPVLHVIKPKRSDMIICVN